MTANAVGKTLICRNLMMVVALAISNPEGSSLGMTAHHALYACKFSFSRSEPRQ